MFIVSSDVEACGSNGEFLVNGIHCSNPVSGDDVDLVLTGDRLRHGGRGALRSLNCEGRGAFARLHGAAVTLPRWVPLELVLPL